MSRRRRRILTTERRSSCPSAEEIVRTTVRELHGVNSSVGPVLLRLAFHDCFVNGCDASVLLDSAGEMRSEKEAIPNQSLRGFEEIDTVKSKVEEVCPAVVSCADIVALAGQESVLLAGGQFYPVFTGRLDSKGAFADMALSDLPGPNFDIVKALNSFAAKGFSPREMVALIGGGHSTGKIHCNFILDRIFNFSDTVKSDPSINADFLEFLKSECSHPALLPARSPSERRTETQIENRAMKMDYEGAGVGLERSTTAASYKTKGLLFVDQQLTSDERTMNWVESYASDLPQFRRDFGLAMFKLTHIQPSKSEGEVRLNCRKLN